MEITVEHIKDLLFDKIQSIKKALSNEKGNHVFQLQYQCVLENIEELLEEIEDQEKE